MEHVKLSISETEITKPKHNLSCNEHKAVKELQKNTAINLKRADKGRTTVILNKGDKIQEAQVQLDNRDHYRPLENPMVTETLRKVDELIAKLHNGKHIDDMTKRWLSQTPNPPRIPIFCTLTKIHKPLPVGRPIISGCEGPTERISSFVDHLLQPIAQKQKSYLKDMTDFINFIEKTEVSQNTILISMDVTSLYTNIPQDEGITIVWKRNIDDVFSLWDVNRKDMDLFIEQGNKFHPTIKFTAEISEKEITFLDTVLYKGERLHQNSLQADRDLSIYTLFLLPPTRR